MGTFAWLCLFPLAVTSTQKSIRSLGKNWVRLHRLIYVATAAGAIHFYWLVKRDKREPLLYLAILTALLGWRVAVRIAKTQRQQKAVGAN
jgi:sulfoxide reductase heme-binding subunit YedZ